jgi:hypothetical protein
MDFAHKDRPFSYTGTRTDRALLAQRHLTIDSCST